MCISVPHGDKKYNNGALSILVFEPGQQALELLDLPASYSNRKPEPICHPAHFGL